MSRFTGTLKKKAAVLLVAALLAGCLNNRGIQQGIRAGANAEKKTATIRTATFAAVLPATPVAIEMREPIEGTVGERIAESDFLEKVTISFQVEPYGTVRQSANEYNKDIKRYNEECTENTIPLIGFEMVEIENQKIADIQEKNSQRFLVLKSKGETSVTVRMKLASWNQKEVSGSGKVIVTEKEPPKPSEEPSKPSEEPSKPTKEPAQPTIEPTPPPLQSMEAAVSEDTKDKKLVITKKINAKKKKLKNSALIENLNTNKQRKSLKLTANKQSFSLDNFSVKAVTEIAVNQKKTKAKIAKKVIKQKGMEITRLVGIGTVYLNVKVKLEGNKDVCKAWNLAENGVVTAQIPVMFNVKPLAVKRKDLKVKSYATDIRYGGEYFARRYVVRLSVKKDKVQGYKSYRFKCKPRKGKTIYIKGIKKKKDIQMKQWRILRYKTKITLQGQRADKSGKSSWEDIQSRTCQGKN